MKQNENTKRIIITILRISIGWHFLYEGVSKLFISDWSAENFLINSTGPLSVLYQNLASSASLLTIVDLLNIYGLIFIGLGLFIGLWVRFASIAGIVLLTLYYFAYPPIGISLLGNTEGHVFIVNKIFIEAAVLFYFIVSKTKGYGLDNLPFLKLKYNKKKEKISGDRELISSRREVLKNLATLPALGLMAWGGFLQNKKYDIDVISGATIQLESSSLKDLKGVLPKGKIGNHEISRLVLGGNLIGGWAHARDLIYVPSLFKAYNTEKKVYETL
ncbi:DoxX family membrane protein, partial [Bacteroidota bacterium]